LLTPRAILILYTLYLYISIQQIVKKGPGKYQVNGKIERIDEETLLISELPVKKWTQDYKVMLEAMMTGEGGKKQPDIDDFKENHTETT
jgi:DNA topoisomerase-2